MLTPPTNGEFNEYRRLILSELERANSRLDKVDERLTRIEKDITALVVKMALVGAGSGAVLGAIAAALVTGVFG